MTETTDESTHTPLYLGKVPEAAVCEHHGEMVRQPPPLIVVDGHVHTPRENVAFYGCPECCLDLFAIAGVPIAEPKEALTNLWKQYLIDDWDGTIEHLFVDLGPGRIHRHDGKTIVLFETEPDETTMPSSFCARTDWFVRRNTGSENIILD